MTLHAAPRLSDRDALFLDFDGTLAPIQDDPESVALPMGGAEKLQKISAVLCGALAIVSGRDIRDLSRRVPQGLWRAGGHGLDLCAPGERAADARAAAPAELMASVLKLAGSIDSVRVEDKGRIVAVHYRAAPDAGARLADELGRILANAKDYVLEHGKCVFELKPQNINKGRLVARLASMPPFTGRTPVMIGDDTTDEAAMTEVLRLGGYAIKVGEGESVAPYRFNTPEDVWRWLEATV
jgi:trehalose 6-phosphate phosphatase